jgi:hypothetical protein
MKRLDISTIEDPADMVVACPLQKGIWTVESIRPSDKTATCCQIDNNGKTTIMYPAKDLRGHLCVSVWSPDDTFSSSPECGVFPVNSEEEALALYKEKCDQYRNHKHWDFVRVEIIDGCYPVGDGTWAQYDNLTASGWFTCEETQLWGQVFEAGGTLHVFDPEECQWADWSDSLPTTRAAESDTLQGLAFAYRNGDQVEYGMADSSATTHSILKEHLWHFKTLLEAATDLDSITIKATISAVQGADPLAFLATFS